MERERFVEVAKKFGKVWEKYGKCRVYVDRNGYEQYGYISPEPDKRLHPYEEALVWAKDNPDIKLYCYPTRVGNWDGLVETAEEILKEMGYTNISHKRTR
jgi:hypothetical protein